MTHTTITDLIASATPAILPAEEEAALIVEAQAGDETARLALIRQYAPAIRNALARFHGTIDREDAEQEAVLALMGVIEAHDPAKSPRLAGVVADALRRALAAAANAASGGWSIPSRTLDRYYGILRRAEGDIKAAAALAPEYEMPSETFLNITAALRGTESVEGLTAAAEAHGSRSPEVSSLSAVGTDPFADIEDRLAVEVAFSALDERETAIMRFSYGFDAVEVDGDVLFPEGAAPLADGLVAVATGLTRPTVQRTRGKALSKMRDALALDEA